MSEDWNPNRDVFQEKTGLPDTRKVRVEITPEPRLHADISLSEAKDRIQASMGPLDKLDQSSPEPIIQFFEYVHLPPTLRAISKQFGDLATEMLDVLPRNPERTVMLRKLLEAKDAAVRACLYKS